MIPPLRAITGGLETDAAIARAAEAACAAGKGALCIHMRDKRRTAAELLPLARRLREITRAHGSTLVLGDAYELAGEIDFDGLHGWSAPHGPARSVPAHDDRDLERALALGAHCALVSPIFETEGKGPPRGLAALASARRIAPDLFLYALGGVTPGNARACIDAGASGVAVVRAVFGARDPGEATLALLRAVTPR